MNFISHFYLDRRLSGSWYYLGVSTPDLVSVYNRSVRLKARRLPEWEPGLGEGAREFREGVLRHFEVDRYFHTSDFFYAETRRLCALFEEALPPGEPDRAFFVAHVLLELVMDKLLLERDSSLAPEFYQHLRHQGIDEIVRMTEWLAAVPLPAYGSYLDRFLSRQYLYDYVKRSQILYILRRIMLGVGIGRTEIVVSPEFYGLVERYEDELRPRLLGSLSELRKWMDRSGQNHVPGS
ncbi:MAG: hypothetical protein NW241_23650 [Bacteroidia bacterium]|nr:hypothetical protein [Bacteroidia bacterium]